MENRRAFIGAAILFSIIFVVSLFVLMIPTESATNGPSLPANFSREFLLIAFTTMILSGIGTFSTLIFGWRNEIRNNQETKLKIEKLDLEIAELKSKNLKIKKSTKK